MKNIILKILMLLLFIACGDKKKEVTSKEEMGSAHINITQEQFEANGFLIGGLEKRVFPNIVEASGMIDVPPQNKAVITAYVGGFVKKTPFLVGDQVSKGQPLITLENQEFVKMQQEYLEVYNRLDFLRAEYERNKTLYEERINSNKKYLEAKSNYETHLARYQGLKKQLEMLNISTKNVENLILTPEAVIFSPIDGSITKMNVAMGSYVAPSTEMLVIVDNDHIHVELTVFEKDILKVEKGQQIDFKIPEVSKEIFMAEVYLVGTSIDNPQRTIKVHGHLYKEDKNLLPGMFVEAKIMTDTAQAWSLPQEAITGSEGSSQVLRLVSKDESNLVFEKVSVNTGSSFEGYTEIENLENLDSDDQFLIKGAFDLIGN